MWGSVQNVCSPCLLSLCLHPAPSFSFHEAKTSCWDEYVLHKQHWMYFSHYERILVQSKSTGEVIAALFHSQLAFKALSGHMVFLNLGSCSIYIHICVAVRHCNATAFKCSWTIIAFQPKNTPIYVNGLSVTQVWSGCVCSRCWHHRQECKALPPSPQCCGSGRAAVASGSAGGMQGLSTAP